jgi:hypothetical protein
MVTREYHRMSSYSILQDAGRDRPIDSVAAAARLGGAGALALAEPDLEREGVSPGMPEAAGLRFCNIRDASGRARLNQLREQIRLPASALADASFMDLEKKETRLVFWGDSNGTVNSSEQCASSR